MTQTMLPPAPTLSQPTQSPQPQYVISDADNARNQATARAWQAYNGELAKPLKPKPDEADDNVVTNTCAPIVDTGVDFLFGKELEISVEEGAPDDAQDFLNDTWGRKETRIPLLQKLAMNGAMAGQAFLRIVPIDKTYRLIVLDPSTVYVQTDPQDCETVQLYCIQYAVSQQGTGRPQTVYYREEISRIDPDNDGDDGNPFADVDASWMIAHWSRIGEHGPWTMVGDPYPWPHPFPPIFSCQNLSRPNDFWGKPDITPDLIGLNNAVNLVQSSINRTIKLYGNPILYATGVGNMDLQTGRVNILAPDGKIVAVSLTSDIANARMFLQDLLNDIDEVSAVPGIATGRMSALPRGDMSGDAIELLYVRVLKKTERKQCTYGEMIIDVSKALLILAGYSSDIDLTLNWQSPLPHDDLPAVQAAVQKAQLGISNYTLQMELGYDPDAEMERSTSEDAQKMTAYARGQGFPPAMNANQAQAQMQGQPPQQQPNQPQPQEQLAGVGSK